MGNSKTKEYPIDKRNHKINLGKIPFIILDNGNIGVSSNDFPTFVNNLIYVEGGWSNTEENVNGNRNNRSHREI